MSERKCPACYAVVESEGAAFCPYCGASLSGNASAALPRANVSGILRRAEMALAEGAFDAAYKLCEMALNEDPECAEAYFLELLASLRITDRAHLSDARALFDGSPYYKKAFRFGDAALRQQLLDALYAIDARTKEKECGAAYENAAALLASAADIPACLEAKRLFLSLGDYRDAAEKAALCDERVTAMRAEWEHLKEQKKEAAAAKKKEDKRILFIALGAAALLAVLAVLFTLIFGVFIPNGMRKDALAKMETGDYDEALALLAEAEERALFDGTQEKIAEAREQVSSAHRRAKEITDAEKRAEILLESGKFLDAIREMLAVDVPVSLQYDAPDAELLVGKEKIDSTVWYRENERFWDIATPNRTAYDFLRWQADSFGYDGATGVYSLTLRAEFLPKTYQILYSLGGGEADNPTQYDTSTPDFTLQQPVRRGYTFLGWTGTGLKEMTTEVTVKTGSTGKRTYTARWAPNTYHVMIDAAGGSVSVYEMDVTFGTRVVIQEPKRLGYDFVGWYCEDTLVNQRAWNIDGDVTITAKWEPISYDIVYHLLPSGTSNPNPHSYSIELGTFTLKAPYPPLNYTFYGWYADAEFTQRVYSIYQGTTGTVHLYARLTRDY